MFTQPAFWLLAAAVFAVMRLTPDRSTSLKGVALAITSLVALHLVFSVTLLALAILATAIAALCFAGTYVAGREEARGLNFALLCIAPLLFVWVIGKIGFAFDDPSLKPLLLVGMSYLLVKVWTFLKDVIDGKIDKPEMPVVFAYLLYFPTWLSGPMHYYGEFRETLARPAALDGQIVLDSIFRFAIGLIKVNVLAALLVPASLLGLPQDSDIALATLVGAAIVYSFVLYFDFSGYCDMVIALSRLLGIAVPENFNRPYIAVTISDFWRRWHITFSRVLTVHIFFPIVRALKMRNIGNDTQVVFVGYLVTFLFCGYWHGATANFLLWGLYHALGLFVQDRWTQSRRKPGVPMKPTEAWSLRNTVSILMTFLFVSVGWIFFVLPIDRLGSIVTG